MPTEQLSNQHTVFRIGQLREGQLELIVKVIAIIIASTSAAPCDSHGGR